ncbi:MAG TPA: hydrogenase maturation protease [Halomicronema sp.]
MDCNIAAKLKTLQHRITLIGYGNDLRSDDGVGQKIADIVSHWGVPNLESLAVPQLTPELAETLSQTDIAIFVDAYPANQNDDLQIVELKPASNPNSVIGHTSDPSTLLTLTEQLYQHTPKAWLVAIPATNFDLGETLSLLTEKAMADALEEIDYLIRHPE